MRARPLPALLATLLLASVYWTVAANGPDARGFWQDDGIYLATAQSLANGDGYRHPELPGRPFQTKYPILWPALLALALGLGGDPRWALLPGALAAAAAVVLGGIYLRRRLGLSRPLAIVATALAAASPSILSLVRFTLSDLPYAAFAVAALLCLDPAPGDHAGSRRTLHRHLAGGALAAAAVLVRPFGVCLAFAAPLGLLLRRRAREAALVALVLVAGVAPWWLWQRWAAGGNGEAGRALLVAPELGYDAFLPGTLPEIARAVVQNATRTAFGVARYELALPESLLTGGFAGSLPRALLAHGVAWLALGSVLAGAAATLRHGARTFHAYLVLYAGLLLVWPFEPFRFLAAWSPLLPGLFLAGASAAAGAAGLSRRATSVLGGGLAALLAILFLVEDARIVRSTVEAFRVAGRDSGVLAEDAEAMDFVRSATRPGDVIASVLPARVFLLTGRPGVALWHDTPPYAIYAGPERSWRRFYLDGNVDALVAAQLRTGLVPAYREAGVRWLLLSSEIGPAALVDTVLARPDLFARAWTSPRGTQAVFAFRPGAPSPLSP